jgi:DNA-binding NarL/FixJ family response regulator
MSQEPLTADEATTGPIMSPHPRLTHREEEVLMLLTLGRSNREIATELSIGTSTVKSHLSSIYEKFGVSNRTQAMLVGLGHTPTSPVAPG